MSEMTVLDSPVNDRTSAVQIAGYRLQTTLVDLVDLAMQAQHLRWNLQNEPALRQSLEDLDALLRAAADSVATRLRTLGVPPDGRVGTAYQDLLFEPLPGGPLEPSEVVSAFTPRLAQFGARLTDGITIVSRADLESASILESIQTEVADWAERFAV